MKKATVYRFEYLDRATGRMCLADDWATERAVGHMGAKLLRETALEVPAGQVGAPGIRLRSKYV
ncbi:MAG TPA: hypothetical protein VII36_02825 [Usitatibacter sp.]